MVLTLFWWYNTEGMQNRAHKLCMFTDDVRVYCPRDLVLLAAKQIINVKLIFILRSNRDDKNLLTYFFYLKSKKTNFEPKQSHLTRIEDEVTIPSVVNRARDIETFRTWTATHSRSDNYEFSRFIENFAVLCNFELYRNFQIAIL